MVANIFSDAPVSQSELRAFGLLHKGAAGFPAGFESPASNACLLGRRLQKLGITSPCRWRSRRSCAPTASVGPNEGSCGSGPRYQKGIHKMDPPRSATSIGLSLATRVWGILSELFYDFEGGRLHSEPSGTSSANFVSGRVSQIAREERSPMGRAICLGLKMGHRGVCTVCRTPLEFELLLSHTQGGGSFLA